jgi:hypothetical protein
MLKTHVKSHDLVLGFCRVCQSSIYALAKPENEAQMRANEICNECAPKLYRERLLLAEWKQFPQLEGGKAMIVYLEPMFGDAKANIERAKTQLEKALGFRGTITDIRAEDNRIMVDVKVNRNWDLTAKEKARYLQDWLPTRVFHFKVGYK